MNLLNCSMIKVRDYIRPLVAWIEGGSVEGLGVVPEPPSVYGNPVDPEMAPEAITKAVASIPPEKMTEILKEMKDCVVNNPQEARDMLLKVSFF